MFNIARKAQPKAAPPTKGTPENVEVEEALGALERARHLGTSKLSLQRLVYVNELVDTAHDIGYEKTVAHLLPIVHKLASDPEVQVRQSLVGHFGDLAGFLIQSDPERGYQKVVDDLLPVVSTLLIAEKVAEVRQGAADALTTLASHLRPGERGDQVLMTVISLSHNNEDEDARSTAVQLLNGLAEALGADLCRQFVGVELVALCEDPAFRVRKATAASFAEVARIVGDEYVFKRLLPAFERLVHDAHWGVRKAAAESLVTLAMSLKAKGCELVPLMNSLLKDASRWVRMAALQQLGYFVASLENAERVPPALLKQYVEVIEQTKSNPDAADISYHCAYTFAAVAKTMGPESWHLLQPAFASLCKDTQATTRKAMAASMHVVTQTLGPDLTEKEVVPQFEERLEDAAPEVRLAALRNVAHILRAAPRAEPQRRVTRALQGSLGKDNNWRLRFLVASQLGPVCDALQACGGGSSSSSAAASAAPSPEAGNARSDVPAHAKDLTWSVLVPLFLQLCGDTVAEVRDEAARATAPTLRAAVPEMFSDVNACGAGEGSSGGCSSVVQAPLPPQTSRLLRHLIRTFANGRSFRNRMTYIRMCDSVVRESPPGALTGLLLRPLVRLALDPVKNVRLCWAATMLPHIRRVGRLSRCQTLIAAALKMTTDDTDVEVRRVLSGARITSVPDGADDGLVGGGGFELDLDEPDKGESWLAVEGGTGDCSDCSDAGVEGGAAAGDGEQQDAAAQAADATRRDESVGSWLRSFGADATSAATDPLGATLAHAPSAPSAPGSAAASGDVGGGSAATAPGPGAVAAEGGSSSAGTSSAGAVVGEAAGTEAPKLPSPKSNSPQLAASSSTKPPPPPPLLAPPSPKTSPKTSPTTSPNLGPRPKPPSPSMAPATDPVEDGLVRQCEMERDMDAKFAERRLLAEAKADASLLSPTSAAAGSTVVAAAPVDAGGEALLGAPSAGQSAASPPPFAPPPREAAPNTAPPNETISPAADTLTSPTSADAGASASVSEATAAEATQATSVLDALSAATAAPSDASPVDDSACSSGVVGTNVEQALDTPVAVAETALVQEPAAAAPPTQAIPDSFADLLDLSAPEPTSSTNEAQKPTSSADSLARSGLDLGVTAGGTDVEVVASTEAVGSTAAPAAAEVKLGTAEAGPEAASFAKAEATDASLDALADASQLRSTADS
eukprot:TRINITY_DN17804_c0_g1_i1.p1 TRINITY_DN17804_c0_g1~~TRINITY_DN17804_c0_g1_i1.p1  ORF type:complete len:1193 (-),score=320.17 TRINITY_DN17804_c0_g1_i1:168-3746(-)